MLIFLSLRSEGALRRSLVVPFEGPSSQSIAQCVHQASFRGRQATLGEGGGGWVGLLRPPHPPGEGGGGLGVPPGVPKCFIVPFLTPFWVHRTPRATPDPPLWVGVGRTPPLLLLSYKKQPDHDVPLRVLCRGEGRDPNPLVTRGALGQRWLAQ